MKYRLEASKNTQVKQRGTECAGQTLGSRMSTRSIGKKVLGIEGGLRMREVTETHPLVAGGQQRSNSVTQTQERGPLLRLAVPALHHHLIPETSNTTIVAMENCTACPAPGNFSLRDVSCCIS